ncbi:hypothetical protein POVWA2_068110 [Plasmodium ovale wallikeri]|uniref:Uncharacterized protein n=1 Tax=Plasmodium ovale wallikeri TaxID=864142 RepID=A0A1A9AH14_PLAOA|nr:hypothetical protein POVWA1_032430 [Plasmodium ovale wallikeri]SBT55482.1 hypothetical protein POVWA2_068110 [Plasmodium ovale wallikeri]
MTRETRHTTFEYADGIRNKFELRVSSIPRRKKRSGAKMEPPAYGEKRVSQSIRKKSNQMGQNTANACNAYEKVVIHDCAQVRKREADHQKLCSNCQRIGRKGL